MHDKINIKIDSTLLREKIETLQKRVDNAGPAFAAIAQVMASSVEKNFEVQGRYSEAGSWKGGTVNGKASLELFSAIGGNRAIQSGLHRQLRTGRRKTASKVLRTAAACDPYTTFKRSRQCEYNKV